jgi:tRNA/tmRNA/rRNA uracil-C5-methylase (TrmA/RlmC/RlmD family)
MAPYLATLVDSYSPDLPLIDVGCGDGTLTRALAESFPQVFGMDISASAITEAQRNRAAANIEYQRLDLTDLNGVAALHNRLGDANLHVRGVLHAISPESRPAALAALTTLAGRGGQLFDIEMSPELTDILDDLSRRFGDLPVRAVDVARAGLQPADITDLEQLYRDAGWRIAVSERKRYRSNMRLPDGEFFEYPFQLVLAHRSTERHNAT